jgi:hypothetical protein
MKETDSCTTLSTMASSTKTDNDSSEPLYLSPGKRPISKGVSWCKSLATVNLVECIVNGPEDMGNVWYDGKALAKMRKREIHMLKALQKDAGRMSIESDEITWRGFEDIQFSWCRVEKSRNYTSEVVELYQNQLSQGYYYLEEIRKVAKALTRSERARVYNLALRDAEEVGIIVVKKRSTIRKASSTVTSISSDDIKRNMKMVRSNNSLAFGMNKVSSITSLKKGVKSMRKSVSNLGNFQWKKNDPAAVSV